ncbi:MAG: radical SAM protein [Nitrospirae bacterium]|nr:radical SAM protein [Nitrospirota bacterium]
MKITFVYPGIAMIGFNSLGGNSHDTISINLGMGYISRYLKNNSDHSADLIDLRDLTGWDHYESELRKREPDIVGVYCNTVNYANSLKSAQIAKGMGKTVIMGGPHATLAPQSLIDTGFVDHVITGEGEISFLKAVNDIEAGTPLEKIVEGEKIEDLDDIPLPDRDLYNMDRILCGAGIFPYPSRYIGIVASRGCHYNCSFCQPLERKIFGRKIRTRSVKNIIEEVLHVIEKYKASFIMFECDTLTTQKEWALELCREMEKIGICWGAQSRADTIDDELARAMRKAGCMVLFIGFESGSQRMLNLLRKGIKPEHSIKAGKICRDNKLLIFANYMLGMPTETKEDLDMTYDMIREIRPELHSPSYFAPIPGSDLYDYCAEKDLIKVASFEGFVRNPTIEKVKGVDYGTLNEYKEKMLRCKKEWWTEAHFLKPVLSRWLFLLRRGYVKTFVLELVENTFFFRIPAVFLLNTLRKLGFTAKR